MSATPVLDMAPSTTECVLAEGEVRFVGDPYALVVASSRALAEDAAELIEFDVEPLPPVVDYEAALDQRRAACMPARTTATSPARCRAPGRRRAARHLGARAARRDRQRSCRTATSRSRWSRAASSPGGILRPVRSRSGCRPSHRTTCAPSPAASPACPQRRIRVRMGDVGGGFGQKAYLARDEQVVLLAGYHLGRPIKWIEDRRENLVAATSSRADRCTVTLAADGDGRILGIDRRPSRRRRCVPARAERGRDGGRVLHRSVPHPEAGRSPPVPCSPTRAPRAPYRGPWQFETYAAEQAIDALARTMGLDPLELRRRNVVHRDELPYTLPVGVQIVDVSPEETLEQAAAIVGFAEFRERQRAELDAGRLLGIGIGLYIEPQTLMGVLQRRARPPPHPTGRQRRRVPRIGFARPRHRDHDGAARRRAPRCRVRRRHRPSRRHRRDALRVRHRRQPQWTHPRRGGARSGARNPRQGRRRSPRISWKRRRTTSRSSTASSAFGARRRGRGLVADVAQAAYHDVDTLPPGMEPGLEVVHRYKGPLPFVFSNACHICMRRDRSGHRRRPRRSGTSSARTAE